MQVECIHFEAFIHVCTIMWRVVFKELRGLTNSKGRIACCYVYVSYLTLTLTLFTETTKYRDLMYYKPLRCKVTL